MSGSGCLGTVFGLLFYYILGVFSTVLALCPQGHRQPFGPMTTEMPWVHNLNPRDNCLLWDPRL